MHFSDKWVLVAPVSYSTRIWLACLMANILLVSGIYYSIKVLLTWPKNGEYGLMCPITTFQEPNIHSNEDILTKYHFSSSVPA